MFYVYGMCYGDFDIFVRFLKNIILYCGHIFSSLNLVPLYSYHMSMKDMPYIIIINKDDHCVTHKINNHIQKFNPPLLACMIPVIHWFFHYILSEWAAKSSHWFQYPSITSFPVSVSHRWLSIAQFQMFIKHYWILEDTGQPHEHCCYSLKRSKCVSVHSFPTLIHISFA